MIEINVQRFKGCISIRFDESRDANIKSSVYLSLKQAEKLHANLGLHIQDMIKDTK
jgi:hypothetical protein